MISYYNRIVQCDLQAIYEENLDWREFERKAILVTGATGLIASYITNFLLFLKREKKMDIKIFVLCRTPHKSDLLYKDAIANGEVTPIYQDVCDLIEIKNVDYIFHLAGNASPYYILNDPVGIIRANVQGTMNVLELARRCKAKVFFASTREVYGEVKGVTRLKENSFGILDSMSPRSCYPESKRAAESLLISYFGQYGVPVYIARIAHTYGPGMNVNNDGRVMSDLIGNALQGEDIVLKSNGEALRAFCYVSDTVSACMYIILKGKSGEAYNLSNETEEISIKNLAEIISSQVGTNVILEDSQTPNAYCNYVRVGLDTSKLEELGWTPQVSLGDGIKRTINYDNK